MTNNYWKKVRLSEIFELLGGGTPKTTNPDFWNGDIPWLSVKDFNNDFRYVYSTEKYITKSGLDNSSTQLLQKDDIIISARGTVGELAMIPYPMAFNQSCYGVRSKNSISDSTFLYYLLKCNIQLLKQNTHGSVFDTITRDTFDNIEIDLPPLPTQKKIADILSSFDDKIELNTRMNKVLEDIAQALFKHWFVEFEFPNHEGKPYKSSGGKMVDSEMGLIPEGWEVSSLDNIADFMNGIACQKYPPKDIEQSLPVIKIKELNNSSLNGADRASYEIPDKYYVKNGDVLFSWSGSLMIDIWCSGEGVLNQHLFKITSDKYPKWYYYLWTKHHLIEFQNIASDKATTMGHIQRRHLSEALVVIPSENEFNKIDPTMRGIINLIINNRVENNHLVNIRDSLLPKLMNGDFDL